MAQDIYFQLIKINFISILYQDSEESSKDGEAEADAKEGGEIRKNSSSFAKLEVYNFYPSILNCLVEAWLLSSCIIKSA